MPEAVFNHSGHILIVSRNKSLGAAHTQGEGVTASADCEEVGIIGSYVGGCELQACSTILKALHVLTKLVLKHTWRHVSYYCFHCTDEVPVSKVTCLRSQS